MIKIGDIITLELKYSDKFEKYRCKLVEKQGENLYIDYPTNNETNKTAFLMDGTQLKCTFLDHNGTVYLFESEVLGRVKQNIPMLKLSFPGEDHLVKIQRRQFVRIETPVDIAIHPKDKEFPAFTAISEDISAGGTAIIISNKTKLKQGMNAFIWLVLPMQNGDYHYMKLESKVVRIIPISEISCKISIQFMNVQPHERQILLRFCFDRQLALKKKGVEM
ncbi:flagellar brake protein [Cytobacillus sp. Hz8]|uniref:flagellar brake protein n=1 Tax=Cytobacillus sp. Hz8 TaxID=3347168 RepID=UPI0035E1C823